MRRALNIASTAVMAMAVLVIGHNLVFLMTYGPEFGVALVRTGHDGRWDATVRDVLGATLLLAAAATLRLALLHRLLRRLGPAAPGGLSLADYCRTLAPLWLRLLAISLSLYVAQENYERLGLGLSLPGLDVLGAPDIAGPVPVFILVSFLVAAVAALFRWGIATLEERIAAIRARVWPAALPQPRPTFAGEGRPASSILGRNLAGRAPPESLFA